MIETLKKLKSVLLILENEHEPITVFALFLREDPLEKWDIVVSALWLNSNERSSYDIVASKIQENLNSSELVQLSRVVILDTTDPAIAFLQDKFSITNGHIEEFSGEAFSDRFGFTIKKTFLLRCRSMQEEVEFMRGIIGEYNMQLTDLKHPISKEKYGEIKARIQEANETVNKSKAAD